MIIAFIAFANHQFKANVKNELLIENLFASSFLKAYSFNPSIPKGVLESIAFSQSRFAHLGTWSQEPSYIGYTIAYRIKGLTENGQNYFRNNLITASSLPGYSIDDIKVNPEKNILAFVKAFSILQTQNNIFGNNLENYKPIL